VGAGLSDETVRAGKNLDRVITTLVDNFSEGSDYFKVLVNVFQSVLLTPDNDHLRTFFMIGTPPPSLPPSLPSPRQSPPCASPGWRPLCKPRSRCTKPPATSAGLLPPSSLP
jgi:hypothetical protein